MTSQLRKIDERGETLLNDLRAGRITEEQYAARLRKLVDRAEAILARRTK